MGTTWPSFDKQVDSEHKLLTTYLVQLHSNTHPRIGDMRYQMNDLDLGRWTPA